MLKSISIWALRNNETRGAAELFAEAKGCGFDGLELAVGTAGLLTPESTERDCAELVRAAGHEGLTLSSLASGLGWQFSLSSDDPDVRGRGLEIVRACARIAGWLGVKCVLVIPGMVSGFDAEGPEHVPYDLAYCRMQESIAEAIPTAEEAGVVLGIENVWNKILLAPLEMRDFIDSFASPWVGSYLDVGNMLVTGYAEDWIRILGKRVASVHFKDFKRSVGTIEGFCDLLEGDCNYPEVMAALREVGYEGPCVAEFFDIDVAALRRTSEAMDKIAAM